MCILKPNLYKVLSAALLISLLLQVSGCYYVRQAVPLVSNQLRSKPLDRCLSDTSISPQQRRFFNEIGRIRAFATDSIGLVKNRNYTRFVPVDSSYLVAVVCGADSASFVTKKWCYPVLGCFPLRGYYDINDALKEGKRLASKGYEIHIDKVDGFSTLGIFSDPLYSFMTDYPVFTLAQFIFHEQMHATAYFKNVQFSEELATYVSREGALAYLRCYYGTGSPEYDSARQFIADQQTFLRILRKLHGDLNNVYMSNTGRADKIRQKLEIVSALRQMLTVSYDSLFATQWYRKAQSLSFNNAYLALRMTYNLDLEMFRALHEKKGSLHETVKYAVQLKKRRGDPKKLLMEELGISP